MKNGLLLLLVLALAGALWLFLGDDGDDPRGGPGTDGYLEGDGGGDPTLKADGTPTTIGKGTGTPPENGAGPEPGAGTIALSGRVVDERRAPVAKAQVELRAGARVLARAASDAQGAYSFGLPPSGRPDNTRIALVAETSDGRSGIASVWLTARGGDTQALPVLVVERAFDLDVQVVREGAGVLGAQVAAVRRGAGVPLLLASENGDEDGRVRLRRLPAGPLELFATAPGHGRGHIVLRLPRPTDAEPPTIALQGERVLSVYVYDQQTRRPVHGAVVQVGDARTMPEPHGPGYLPSIPPTSTNRKGYAVVRRLGLAETIYVNARAPGYAFAPWWRSKSQTAPPKQDEVRIALSRRRTVRCPILEYDVPTPPDGTPLRVESRVARREGGGAGLAARIDGGDVVIEGLGPGVMAGTVFAPSGAQAAFSVAAAATEGSTLTFRMPRTVRVRVTETDGTPVGDLALRLTAGGRAPAIAPAVTNADGLAVFEAVGSDRASLHLKTTGQPFGGPLLANLDLSADDEVHEIVLQPGIDVVLTLRLDGEPRLPPDYTLMVAGQRFDPARIEENAAAGELRCRIRPPTPDGSVRVDLYPRGFLQETLEIDPDDGDVEETFDLRPAGRLVVRVTPPDDGQFTLQLQRHDEGKDSWVPAQIPSAGSGVAARRGVRDLDGTHTYEGLAPGRYRAFDRRSRQPSEPVDVAIGAQVTIAFDLSRARWIEGRVVAPAGAKLIQARVLVEGRDSASGAWSGVRARADGTFRVRAYGDKPLTLRVVHPVLSPAERGGRVTVRAGAGAVELRLEQGPELQFRVTGYESATTPESGLWRAPLTVHLVPEGSTKGGVQAVAPVAADGLFRAGGFRPGTYTVWITFGREHAPYVKRGVQIGRANVQLGTVTPPAGSTLRVRLSGLDKSPNATLWAIVSREEPPAYTRHGRMDRELGELVSRGLGPGRFRIVVRGAALSAGAPGARVLLDEVVELDGKSDKILDLEVR